MRQIGVGAVHCIQQPEQRDIAGTEFGDLVGTFTAPSGKSLALGLQHAKQTLAQTNQRVVCADM